MSAQNIEGELNLAAWIVRANGRPTEREVRTYLLDRFPAHMVPSRVTFVAHIPRKPNGKVDTTALVRPARSRPGRKDSGPTELAGLFSELLGHKIGPRDNFFLFGGHSLLAVKLLGRIEARYGARISVSDFIAAPTATDLWKRVQVAPSPQRAVIQNAIPAEVPVSAQQSRALLAHGIGCPSLGNIVLVFRVSHGLDTAALTQVLETVARRNFLLRCGFFETGSGGVLREASELPGVERRILDGDSERAIVDLARREGSKPFALDGCRPWFRMLLAFTGRRNSHLIVITHHAVADGWACESFLNDLRGEYGRSHVEQDRSLQPEVDYRSYALHQAQWLQGPAARKQAAFWKARLAGAEEPRLPFRRPSSATSWQAERYEVTLPMRLSRDLRRVAGMYGTTPFALAMACFKALIYHYNSQQDILLGTVVSNRSATSDQSVRGPLQNPVLIRDSVTADMPMRMLVRRVAHSLSEAEENGALPFEQVIREALPDRPLARDGGIQFLSHDRTSRRLRLGSASLKPVELPVDESPFELSIGVSVITSCLKLAFEYRPGVYPSSGIKHLARQYAALLQSVAANPHATVRELKMTPANELRAFERRLATAHRPRLELLHQGFEAHAQENPNAVAIAAAGRCLTYGELDSMSQSTAGALIGGGLKAGGLVAVMLKKGWEQIVACLAVLKAGGVYVPVDPALPAARLEAIFGQGKFHGAIVAEGTPQDTSRLTDLRSRVTISSAVSRGPAPQRTRTKPDSLAYIIFTSGSTGVPKGVMTSHRAAMTTIQEISRRFRLGRSDRILAVSSLGFDLSVFDIFGTLRAGGRIVMPATHDPKEWVELIRREKLTVWNSVPCLFELLLDEAVARGRPLETLRLILLSGDFISPALARRARGLLPRTRLVCLGGATEAGIWSIAHEVKADPPASRSVPYGRALRGQEMFVLDSALNHCATGVTGELFIAGASLAEGYWHNPSETRRRFVLHPRRHIRLYRTGDQGRYLDNGEIEILGRLDAQVKVNGVRLELGEIEAALCSAPTIRQAVAEIRVDQTGNTRLIAFAAAQPGTDASVLSVHMRKMLPAALLPAAYVLLDRLPLTPTGKVDRAFLRAMSVSSPAKNGATPANPTERAIAEIWSVLLGGVAVGVEQDFFSLGGHSLLAIQMLQRVRSHFAVDLPLSFILDHPTVRGLAMAVNAAMDRTPQPGLPRRATTDLEHDSEPVMSKPVHRTQRNPDAVVLTGATGNLGSALLVELLERTAGHIYCLVRSASRQEAEARLSKILHAHNLQADLMQRVVAVPADLSREQLGLDPSALARLARDIHAVYHCAAEVNFIASYEKLAASNVGGVREIIRLASAADATLHYVSSVAVFPYGGSRIVRENDDIAAVTMLTGGYAQSKWASERLVWKAIARGLRAVIYRPAQIIGGRADGPRHDLFHHILRACNILHAVPDIDANIDVVTSEYAASAIRCISAQRSSVGSAFHLVHPEPVSLRDFIELFPMPLPLVALESWLGRLRQEAERSDDPSLRFISMLAQGLERTDVTPPEFDCSGTVARLRGTGISCPPLDRQFIQRALALPHTTCGTALSEEAA